MQSNRSTGKKGYTKIRECCKIAAAAGFEYVWVDTCCIDKTSSAELTEAINSMFEWYRRADVCYIYLADYPGGTRLGRPFPSFRESRWFRRGWTLQELLAPKSVIFFDGQWEDIGTKHSLREEISEITDIQPEALLGAEMEDFSIAQRMCWASKRETTRIEDEAYSLLGIFGVYMPMLYGEGPHAFIRLQEEIIKRSTDHTIFAWPHGFPTTRSYTGGLLADRPAAFVNTKSIVRDFSADSLPFEITNKGVHLHLPFYEESFGVLNCEDLKRPGFNLAISLTRKDSTDTFHFDYFQGAVIVPRDERQDAPVHSIYVPQGGPAKSLPAGLQFESSEYYFEYDFPHSGLFCESPGYQSKWSQPPLPRKPWPWPDISIRLNVSSPRETVWPYDWLYFQNPAGEFEFGIDLDGYRRGSTGTCRMNIRRLSRDSRDRHWIITEDIFGEGHDRILWQHPVAKFWISVGISRAIISGRRAMVFTLKDEPE